MKKPNVTLVTGASSGIGEAICRLLLDQGHHVVDLDRQAPSWQHERLHYFNADLCDPAASLSAVAHITSRFNVIGLVNNAGATRPGTIDEQSCEDLDHVVALTLRATMQLTQAMLPSLRACGHGRIVNISSRAALGKVERIAYSTVKAGLLGMTRSLAMELGRDGITVNAIAPGPIATELFRKSNPDGAPRTQRIQQSIVVGRMGHPDDVARAAAFFLDPLNGFVTGQTLYVCGGVTLGLAPV